MGENVPVHVTGDTADATGLGDDEGVGASMRAGGPPRWAGPLVGLLSMAAGLVATELVAGTFSTPASPLVEVGNRVVDLVPDVLRDWAISTLGTNDKAVLLAGVATLVTLIAAGAGVMAVRGRHGAAIWIVGAVVVIGAVSALGRGGGGAIALLATLLGGAVAASTLWWLGALAAAGWRVEGDASGHDVSGGDEPGGDEPGGDEPGEDERDGRSEGASPVAVASRRRFFTVSGALAGATVVGGGVAAWLRSNAAVAAERLGITLPRPAAPLPEVPEEVEVGLQGVSPFFTPNDEFYRIDTALTVPRVSTEDWSLRVHGLVDRELTLDYQALLGRPMIELDATIACVSNYVGGDLIGNARWLGCRLDDLLEEAGIDPAADQVVGRSVDGFTAGFPTTVLDGRDALVAVGMNGEPLPTTHGYPARLIVPGLYGYVSATKWLAEIELTTFGDFEGYWIPRGWDREAPVLTSSRFDTPADGTRVGARERFGVGGVAWAMSRGIASVEVRIDDGPWESATLGEEYSGTTWRQWRHDLQLPAGEHTLTVRAVDSDGITQTGERRPPGPNASTRWHTITVTAA